MEGILLVGFFAFGAVVASFVGVVSERLYTGQSWVKGRSKCNSCNVALAPLDLVPIFSWLAFLGRCRSCGVRVSFVYVLYEALLGSLFALSFSFFGVSAVLPVFLIFLSVLFFVVVYDIRHTIVPQGASTALVVLGLVLAALSASSLYVLGVTLVVGGVISLLFFLLYLFSKGRAMGLGDAPIALALSLAVSSQAFTGLVFSFWIGALYGIAVLLLRRGGPTMGIEVPFVPFLAAGFLLAYFTGWNIL